MLGRTICSMQNSITRKVLRDASGAIVLGGYPVYVYNQPVGDLPEPPPRPDRRGVLFFDSQEGVMLLWDGGGVDFFDFAWVRLHVLMDFRR